MLYYKCYIINTTYKYYYIYYSINALFPEILRAIYEKNSFDDTHRKMFSTQEVELYFYFPYEEKYPRHITCSDMFMVISLQVFSR